MQEVVKVQIRTAGEIKYFISNGMKFDVGDTVIIEAEKGIEYGTVVKANDKNIEKYKAKFKILQKIIRKANPWDENQIKQNKTKTKELINICQKKIQENKLPMKLVNAEYSFDRSKIIFYFTSDNRVDFRNLVKDLASVFRVRIELRQIGVRDEAKMFGGYGFCGRKLCCKSFIKDFAPVTIKMAKIQNLSLTPSKISGLCGRLMCCLGYEYKSYKEGCKMLPRIGKEIKVGKEKGKVIEINPVTMSVKLDFGEGHIKEVKIGETKKGINKT